MFNACILSFFCCILAMLNLVHGNDVFKDNILSLMNKERNMVGSKPLKWADDLANFANEHANFLKKNKKCQLIHRTDRKLDGVVVGENLARWMGDSVACDVKGKDPAYGVCLWNDEKKDYRFGRICSDNYPQYKCGVEGAAKCHRDTCGHYTQVVYGTSKEVGCSSLSCHDGQTILVCNFRPAGNFLGQFPFDAKYAQIHESDIDIEHTAPIVEKSENQFIEIKSTRNGCYIRNNNPNGSSTTQRIKVKCGDSQEGVSLFSENFIKQFPSEKYDETFYSRTILKGCKDECKLCSVSSGAHFGPWCS